MHVDPLDYEALREQIRWQREKTWSLEDGLPWSRGVDPDRYCLPLDDDAVAFPGLAEAQRVVLSQYLGLVVNGTIAEMEGVIHKLKDVAWGRLLRRYPVNPEMRELGELFFEEELKHARMFGRYNDVFCRSLGIDPDALGRLMPRAFGSLFQRAVIDNARTGGHAFWWLVSSAEEVSIAIYQSLHRWRDAMDPLYFAVHRRHLEDESRHRNYAVLMLELVKRSRGGSPWRRLWHRKTDLLFSQLFSTLWVVSELTKVFEAKKLAGAHPFFETLASCLPHFRQVGPVRLVEKLFVSAPYVSLVLNTRYHRHTLAIAKALRTPSFPFPAPKPATLRQPGRPL
jgi:hypothetical protein